MPSSGPAAKVLITSITVENFKSIQRLDLKLKPGLNVLVGPNGSGKSNILEALYFLRKALVDEVNKAPYMPHVPDYWSPLDLLYNRDPAARLTYRIKMLYRYRSRRGVHETPLELRVVFAVTRGISSIEPVEIALSYGDSDTVTVFRPEEVEVHIRSSLADMLLERLRKRELFVPTFLKEKLEAELRKALRESREYAILKTPSAYAPLDIIRLSRVRGAWAEFHEVRGERDVVLGVMLSPLLVPVAYRVKAVSSEEFKGYPLSAGIKFKLSLSTVLGVLSGMILLKHPDVGRLREPQPLRETSRLDTRASNLAAVLYAITGRRGGLPERFTHALSRLFPGTRLRFETLYGRVALYVEEDGLELPPPNIPDGLFKLLSILAAVELGPSLLLIDEIENSMHRSMIEYVVDTLDSLEVPVLVATHSPIVVDLAGPEKTLVTVKEPGKGTAVEAFSSPRELLRRLDELGVAFSDYIFHKTSIKT